MRKTWTAVGLGLVVVLAGTTAWAGEAGKLPTAGEVLEKMKAKWARMKTLEMDRKETARYDDTGNEETLTWHVAAERWEKNGKAAGRRAVTVKRVTRTAEGKEEAEETKRVNDGTYTWTEHRGPEGARVIKEDAQEHGIGSWGSPDALEEWVRQFRLKVTGEDTIDGQKMYVIEGRHGTAGRYTRLSKGKVWIGQDDLVIHRDVYEYQSETMDRPGIQVIENFNVKVDQKIDPKVFEYVPPEGAVVVDMTKKGQ